MKSHAEIYRALLDGKTLVNKETGGEAFLDNYGCLADQDGDELIVTFQEPSCWKIKEEPKKLYAYSDQHGCITFYTDDLPVLSDSVKRCPEYDLEYPCK